LQKVATAYEDQRAGLCSGGAVRDCDPCVHSSWPQRQGSSGPAVLQESLQYGVVPGTMHSHCGWLHRIAFVGSIIDAPLDCSGKNEMFAFD
jgi:hypothetical protein